MTRHVTRPWQPLLGIEHLNDGRCAGVSDHKIGHVLCSAHLRHQITSQVIWLRDGCRQADGRCLRRKPPQPREAE